MTNKKHNCTYPACTCAPLECAAEENSNGQQLSFGERVSLEDEIDHNARDKDEGRTISDLLFVVFIAIILISGAIGTGFIFGLRNNLDKQLPPTDYVSQSIKVETISLTQNNTIRAYDTIRLYVIEKRMYLYQTLTDEQKKQLKESIAP